MVVNPVKQVLAGCSCLPGFCAYCTELLPPAAICMEENERNTQWTMQFAHCMEDTGEWWWLTRTQPDCPGIPDDRATVVYKRPTDLALLKDVAICCNVLVCDIMDDGARHHSRPMQNQLLLHPYSVASLCVGRMQHDL